MKKHLSKFDIFSIFLFIFSFLIIYLILTKDGYLYASKTDFVTQHYLFPEYFRKLFYDTKDILPDFAFNLGSGQNIYYFSYYGLLNPIILISYLFPFIPMIDYMIISTSLIVIISTILFYFFLKKNNFNNKVCLITSLLFLFSGPLIFHSHRHIMFMNYFPFLILGLFAVDEYLEKNKRSFLILMISLMIFTSYYYSVSGLVVLFIYYIYKYIEKYQETNIKDFIKATIPFICGIMISMIIILPTFYTLLNGRDGTGTFNFIELIKPNFYLLYDSYGIGLTLISLVSLIYMLFNKKENRFLSIICLLISIFPIFNYILNGTLYINSKSLIPFIPLILLLSAKFLEKIFSKKNNFFQISLMVYLVISALIICLNTNLKDELLPKETINSKEYNSTIELINDITGYDKSYYRISNLVFKIRGINKVANIREYKTTMYSSAYNGDYKKFYFDVFNNSVEHRNLLMTSEVNNLLFQNFIGEKYIVSKEKLDLELVKEKNNIKLYKNSNALPIGFAMKNTISNKEFNSLDYPNNIINMFSNIVTNKGNNKGIEKVSKTKIDYEIVDSKNLKLSKDNKYIINAYKGATMNIKINNDMTNKLLFIRFTNYNNPNNDIAISINGIKNKLTSRTWKYHNGNYTFDYVLYNTNNLNIDFTKGLYKLGNFEFYLVDLSEITNKNYDEFKISKIKGDVILGNINVTDDSYFNISIPYDKGFKIYVDNKLTSYEKTNNSFIGFPISKGKHNIKIEYSAPYKKISLVISLIGVVILIISFIKERIDKK